MLDFQIVNATGVMFDALHGCKSSDWNALSCHISSFSPSPHLSPSAAGVRGVLLTGPGESYDRVFPQLHHQWPQERDWWAMPDTGLHIVIMPWDAESSFCAVLIWKGRHLLCLSDMRRSIFTSFKKFFNAQDRPIFTSMMPSQYLANCQEQCANRSGVRTIK